MEDKAKRTTEKEVNAKVQAGEGAEMSCGEDEIGPGIVGGNSEKAGATREELAEFAKQQMEKYEKCNKQLVALQTEFNALQALHENYAQTGEHVDEVKTLRKAVQDKVDENLKMADKTRVLLRRFKEVKKQLANAKQDGGETGSSGKAAIDAKTKAVLLKLKSKVEELETGLDAKTQQMASIVQELDRVNADKSRLMQERDGMERARNAKAQELVQAIDRVGELEGYVAQLSVERDSLVEQIQDLQGKRDSKSDEELQRALENTKKLQAELKSKTGLLDTLQNENEMKSHQIESLQKVQAENQQYMCKMEELEKHLQARTQELGLLRSESQIRIHQLEQTLESRDREHKAKVQELMGVLHKQQEDSESRISTLQARINELITIAETNQNESQRLELFAKSFDDERASFQTEKATLLSEIESKNEKLDRLETQLETLKQDLERSLKANEKHDQLNGAVQDLQSQLERATKEKESLHQDLKVHASELEQLKRDAKMKITALEKSKAHPKPHLPISNSQDTEKVNANDHEIERAKCDVLLSVCEHLAAERARALEKVAQEQERINAMESKSSDLNRRAAELAKRFKVAKLKLAKETKEHFETKKLLEESKQTKAAETFQEHEELLGKIHALESFVQGLSKEKDDIENKNKQLKDELEKLAREKSVLERDVQTQADELIGEKSRATIQVEAWQEKLRSHQERIAELESELSSTRESLKNTKHELKRVEKELVALKSAPLDFQVRKHVLCTVTVRDTLWVCVDVTSRVESDVAEKDGKRKLQWFPEDQVKEWVRISSSGSVMSSRDNQLPEPLEVQLRREAEEELEEARGNAAAAIAQVESMHSELSRYKRRAQSALKKAQDEVTKASDRRLEQQEQLVSQLQEELSRTLQQRDACQAELDSIRAEYAALGVSLAQAKNDAESARDMHNQLERSLESKLEALRQKMETRREEIWQEERARYEEQINFFKERASREEKRAQEAAEELEEVQHQIDALQQETRTMRARLKDSETLVANLQDTIAEMEETAKENAEKLANASAATTTLSSNAFRAKSNLKRGDMLNAPENTGNELLYPSTEIHVDSRKQSSDPGTAPILASIAAESENRLEEAAPSPPAPADEPSNANGFFVEQFDILRKQHERDRISWQQEMAILRNDKEEAESHVALLRQEVAALKENIREEARKLERYQRLGNLGSQSATLETSTTEQNLTYLKNVVLKYICAENPSERKTLLTVLATMLQFSKTEKDAAAKAVDEEIRNSSSGWIW